MKCFMRFEKNLAIDIHSKMDESSSSTCSRVFLTLTLTLIILSFSSSSTSLLVPKEVMTQESWEDLDLCVNPGDMFQYNETTA
jgi:hypothetical protein